MDVSGHKTKHRNVVAAQQHTAVVIPNPSGMPFSGQSVGVV